MKYVIIGNSAAAVGTVEGIREIDKNGEITIISAEHHHTYSRPLISYLLYGKTDEERMKYRPDSFYDDNDCKLVFDRVVSVDKESKKVATESGKSYAYDKLTVATGSRPFIPPMAGLDNVKNKFTFMTLDDAKAVEKAVTKESRVLIVGAGLIGLKAAEGIRGRAGKLTVIDLSDQVLPSIMDKRGAEIIKKHLENKGIELILGDSAKAFTADTAELNSGKKLKFDVLIIAVGVRPNIELVKEIGGECGRAIVVDDYCKTSLDDIYAAGDCTESIDITTDTRKVLALLPNAYMQGEIAGRAMAGNLDKKYNKAIAMNAMGLFGLHMITAGSRVGEATVIDDGKNYRKFFVDNGRLVGYILIGDISRAGIYTSMIREKMLLSDSELELSSVFERPQLAAMPLSYRKEHLAGVKEAE